MTKTYAVVPHHDRRVPTGRGYVVRPMVDGEFQDCFNYGGVQVVREFQREHNAKNMASRMNGVPVLTNSCEDNCAVCGGYKCGVH